jgi:lauroyl/myristoyl acyltransferase
VSLRLGYHATRALARLTTNWPRLGLRAIDLAAGLGWPRLPHERVRSLFPHLSEQTAKRITAQIRRVETRNQILMRMMWIGGLDAVRPFVMDNPGLAELRPPIILGTFHIGAIPVLGPALEQVPGQVLVLRRSAPGKEIRSRLRIESTSGDDQRRALSFYRAIEWLRDGKAVFMPLDPEQAVRIEAPFHGQQLQLARGPFAMSRMMKVPIVPIVARWRGPRVEIVLGDPIAPDEDESVIAAGAAAWLEHYLLDSPFELSARILELTAS